MLNSSHDNPVGILLGYFKFGVLLQFFDIEHSSKNLIVESLLVA